SISWTPGAPGSFSLTAVATDNLGATTTSAAVSVTADSAPTVSITAPAGGATISSPPAITVSANAADSDGTITQVQFSANGSPIGTDSTSPYSISWAPAQSGSYALTAFATDNQGATTTSAVVNITVTTGNSPPAVNITAPSAGASLTSTPA